jgi:phytoene synthase
VSDATVRAGKAAIASGSKSFAGAARLFDASTRESAVMLYAWCRHCDDVIDGQDFGHAHRAGTGAPANPAGDIAELERKTRAALAGEPSPEAAFAGLARVVRQHDIPVGLPLAHLAGFRMDVEGRPYRTLEDTLDYCYHVAGVVGLMMAHVMGVRDPAVLDRACDLGLAFQLTNIARDVVPDAREGRIYLPETWLAAAGIARNDLADPRHRAALSLLAGRLVDVAEPYYASALAGIARLPPRSAWGIAAARAIYREIGHEVRRRGPRAWDVRVSTSTARKLWLAAGGALSAVAVRRAAFPPRAGLWTRPS